MAITAATTTGEFAGFLSPEMSAPIFDEARRFSVAQSLIRRVPMGPNGVTIPITTAKPTAGWVDEAGRKPASKGGRDLIPMTPKKLAAIVVTSAEVVRANPGGYVTGLRGDLAEAFAVAFDYASFHNLGGDGTGTGPFDNYIAETTKAIELGTASQAAGGVHGDFVAALSLLVNDGKRLTGWALDDTVEPIVLGATDANGRPLYVDLPYDATSDAVARPGRVINRPSYIGSGVANGDIVGFAGDWSKAAWGVVGGISYDVSTQATVTIGGALTSLWEHNLVAVRAEAEYGFVVADTDAFVELTNAA